MPEMVASLTIKAKIASLDVQSVQNKTDFLKSLGSGVSVAAKPADAKDAIASLDLLIASYSGDLSRKSGLDSENLSLLEDILSLKTKSEKLQGNCRWVYR